MSVIALLAFLLLVISGVLFAVGHTPWAWALAAWAGALLVLPAVGFDV